MEPWLTPPLVRPRQRGKPPWRQTGGGRVRLQVLGVDHGPVRFYALTRQRNEDTVQHTEQASTHNTIVKRLVRAVSFGRILPLQSMLDHVNDPAGHRRVARRERAEKTAISAPIGAHSVKTDRAWRQTAAKSRLTLLRAEPRN